VIHDHLVLKWFLTTCLACKNMNKLVGMTTTGECSGRNTAKWWNWKLLICKISKGNMTDVTSEVEWTNNILIEGYTSFVFMVYLIILPVSQQWLVWLTLWSYRWRQQFLLNVSTHLPKYKVSHPRYSWFYILGMLPSNGSKTFVNKVFLYEIWVILFILINSNSWILIPLMAPAFQNL
jgi:hypothetical protein